MNIALLPVGSRGDVQPLLALALRLRRAGHTCRFGAPEHARERIAAAGFEVTTCGSDIQARMRAAELEKRSRLAVLPEVRSMLRAEADSQIDQCLAACRGADLALAAGASFGGYHSAEALGIPYAFAWYAPTWIPSAAHPPIFLPFGGLPGWLNRLLWRLMNAGVDRELLGPINRARSRLGLDPLGAVLESTGAEGGRSSCTNATEEAEQREVFCATSVAVARKDVSVLAATGVAMAKLPSPSALPDDTGSPVQSADE